jgi:hypothetical protein
MQDGRELLELQRGNSKDKGTRWNIIKYLLDLFFLTDEAFDELSSAVDSFDQDESQEAVEGSENTEQDEDEDEDEDGSNEQTSQPEPEPEPASPHDDSKRQARAKWAWNEAAGAKATDVHFEKGAWLEVTSDKPGGGWCMAKNLATGLSGMFPTDRVEYVPGVELFECDSSCGFIGTHDEVEAHEAQCPKRHKGSSKVAGPRLDVEQPMVTAKASSKVSTATGRRPAPPVASRPDSQQGVVWNPLNADGPDAGIQAMPRSQSTSNAGGHAGTTGGGSPQGKPPRPRPPPRPPARPPGWEEENVEI